jgi:alkanesulfonate monooxygenase SsuD/methylene tetrahydromethanopterin reductase-like flavin-dependent oxidoreductase (luciferase family)
MEFGLMVQNYVPKFRREVDPDAEHHVIMDELELARAADRAGFKYFWVVEHHFLDEYSHMSANDVVAGYIAATTTRIHIGSGIFNPLPQVNHPAKVAERVAMLDHISEGRFDFGTGRGAGSHEILGFLPGMTDLSKTREIWEDVIGEFKKMWMQEEYEGYRGKYWSLPPRKVLPKPWVKPHPPMWYACGNTASYEMAARKGLGVLGFSVGTLAQLEPVLKAYKDLIPDAEPVGAFVNDNIMVVNGAIVSEDTAHAREIALRPHSTYLQSLLFRYHDTFPRPAGVPAWPELLPDTTPERLDQQIAGGGICGDPEHALTQCRRWESLGLDQLCISPNNKTTKETLETIRLLGEYVIPKLDTDPVHRSSRMRDRVAVAAGPLVRSA